MNLNGRRVLVTGADGFIGSHLVEQLVREGSFVRALAYYNSFGTWGWLDSLPGEIRDNIHIVSGDIRDSNCVRSIVKNNDIIFHLAALIAIPFSYQSPDSYVDTNIKGTLNVLQASRDFEVEKVLITSTSEVYGTARYVPINEAHPLQAQSPYSASKIGADRIAESFYRSFNTPVTIVRPFNTYGPRQSARAIIPTILIQLLSGIHDIKLGSLHPTRDFLYVQDTVEGFIAIAKSDKVAGEEINIATGIEISIGDLLSKIIDKLGVSINLQVEDTRVRPSKSEVERLLGSNEKICRLTDWIPRINLDMGLEETIRWFAIQDNLKKYKASIYNI